MGLLLGLWLLAWLAVPPIARTQLQKVASDQLGRQVTVERIDFRPWSLELAVEGLSVATADGAAVQLSVQRIYIDGELQSLLRWAPVIDAIRIESPQLSVRHLGDGRYDIDDLIARLTPARPPEEPSSPPARFALYNLAVTGGSVDFRDDVVGRTHVLRDLTVGVPFLSNLPSQREVQVLPRLAFVLNGSRFDSGGEATPFAEHRKARASFRLTGLDVSPYLGYLPAVLPVRLLSAVVDADLTVAFEQEPATALRLGGRLEVSGVRVSDAQGADLLAFERLGIELADVRPLENIVRLESVTLDAPVVSARRDAQGRINLAQLGAAPPAGPAQAPRPAASAPGPGRAAPAAWLASVARVAVRNARLDWHDAATRPATQLALEDFSLDAAALSWPLIAPMSLSGSGKLAGSPLSFKGEGTDAAAKADVQLAGFALQKAEPYLNAFLLPALSGEASADLALEWTAPALAVKVRTLALDNVALVQGRQRLAGWRKLALAEARIDLAQRSVEVGTLAWTQPQMRLERGSDGVWQPARWLRGARAEAAGQRDAAASPTAASAWHLQLDNLSVDAGALSFLDQAHGQPVALELSALRLRARNVSPEGARPSPLQLSARLAVPGAAPGRLDFNGSVTAKGPGAQGRIDASALPVHALAPYLSEVLNIELLRAQAGFRGQVRFAQDAAGPRVQVVGDASLTDLRANTAQARRQAAAAPAAGAAAPTTVPRPAAGSDAGGLGIGQELLSWKTLALRGLAVDMAPGKPTRVDVRETALADFYANVSISESGRINLQDIVRHQGDELLAAGPTQAVAAAPAPPASAAGASAGSASADKLPAVIHFGPIVVSGGRVQFADRFVRPNYSADLSELTGRLGAFSSVAVDGQPQMAELDLRGRAEGTATLEITGRLNPLAQPLALDIHGKVRDLELPPLSPYSVKYAGHGIERGKLSVDVAYKVQPDGQLTAANKLVLHQLTFGEPVPGAPASLPVRLAVALLADRNGVIDVDLPVSGSLNDPQFSLGPVIFKVIVNLVVKAITAPFSLLAGLGAGGDELSAIEFVPGTVQLKPNAQSGLDKVAKALLDRPALRLTVIGTASLEDERGAWQRARLAQLVLAEKRRAATLAGRDAQAIAGVGADEYPALLKEVYRRADMPKPRNLVGLQKDLPQTEMEALLLSHLTAGNEAMRELAVQRAVVVRDYLAARQLPLERLFLGAPRLGGEPVKAPAAGGSAAVPETVARAWTPRAELTLATR